MLRTDAGLADGLFDLALPEPLRDLPSDLAAIDELLRDDKMLAPFRERWDEEVKAGRIGSEPFALIDPALAEMASAWNAERDVLSGKG